MAGSRRGRSKGFPGGGTLGGLGDLIRSAIGQAGAVRDVLERGAREGRARLDDARLERQRADALVDLGEAVLAAIRRGDLTDLEELPEIAHAVSAIDELDARIEEVVDRQRRPGRDRQDLAPSTRRARPSGSDAPWQSVRDPDHDADDELDETSDEIPRRRRTSSDDGTVSSADWRPPRPAAPPRVWRPPVDAEETAVDRPSRRRASEPARDDKVDRPSEVKRRPEPRAGGISFGEDEDEDDLRDYMHPDDVPPKDTKPDKK
jgi:hypothetical protein